MRVSGAITPHSIQLLAQDRAAASTVFGAGSGAGCTRGSEISEEEGPPPLAEGRVGCEKAGTVRASVVCVV